MPKKTERGDPLRFLNILSVAKHQKNARGTLWGTFFFEKNSHNPEKKLKGGPFFSPGIVLL